MLDIIINLIVQSIMKWWRDIMYKPTEKQVQECINIIKDILNIDDVVICKKFIDEIFNIAYSIGGDYSEKTLRSIAEVVLKDI